MSVTESKLRQLKNEMEIARFKATDKLDAAVDAQEEWKKYNVVYEKARHEYTQALEAAQ